MTVANGHSATLAAVSAAPFLATDIGGTHARIALVRAAAHDARGEVEVLAYRSFACADFPGLDELLRAFVAAEVRTPVKRCVLACAGQVVGDEVVNDNSAWPMRLSSLRQTLGLDELAVLNDFEALGYALDPRHMRDARLLCGPRITGAGPMLVIGPGTGLGAAVRMPGATGTVLTTEAGQIDFAPHSLREREILAWLAPDGGYVAYESLLSGPGLLTLYRALCALEGVSPRLADPAQVTAAATAGDDPQASEAVAVFCGSLGSFVGSLAMTFMAFGGVCLAGGFLDAMFALLKHSAFEERFLHARSVRALLERVPVRVTTHGRLGVLGAARWYLRRSAGMQRPIADGVQP